MCKIRAKEPEDTRLQLCAVRRPLLLLLLALLCAKALPLRAGAQSSSADRAAEAEAEVEREREASVTRNRHGLEQRQEAQTGLHLEHAAGDRGTRRSTVATTAAAAQASRRVVDGAGRAASGTLARHDRSWRLTLATRHGTHEVPVLECRYVIDFRFALIRN